jgi:hypothetical protein
LLDGILLSGDTLIDSIDLFVEVRYSVLLIAILSLSPSIFSFRLPNGWVKRINHAAGVPSVAGPKAK